MEQVNEVSCARTFIIPGDVAVTDEGVPRQVAVPDPRIEDSEDKRDDMSGLVRTWIEESLR